MEVRFLGFGSIEVEGREYGHDIVIDRGAVRKRSKKPSKPYRDTFGHTPLSVAEEIPWGGPRLIIGTGTHGALPMGGPRGPSHHLLIRRSGAGVARRSAPAGGFRVYLDRTSLQLRCRPESWGTGRHGGRAHYRWWSAGKCANGVRFNPARARSVPGATLSCASAIGLALGLQGLHFTSGASRGWPNVPLS